MNNSNNKTAKKLSVSIGFILASFAYAFYQNQIPVSSVVTYKNNSSSPVVAMQNYQTTGSNPTLTSAVKKSTNVPKKVVPTTNVQSSVLNNPVPIPIPVPVPVPAPAPAGQYKNGTYTGVAADAYYGTIQVEAIIQNGALADIQFLQYPSDRSTSVRINSRAMPILKQEAISAQSANVNIVSGATDSSQAFQQSLASALSQA